ncbi:hypothetical protein, partial [Nocardia tengchongensis]|uniref:hypothetical protein n=1 Tax=Nocardia tengchongensis TaxID=2055889 RepID=UPI00361B85A4
LGTASLRAGDVPGALRYLEHDPVRSAWDAPPYMRLRSELTAGWIDEARLARARERRGKPGQRAVQPGPYWAIETPGLLVVGVDTGIRGDLDREQTDWLREVSRDPRPKVLVTGKPIYTRNEYKPSKLAGGGTVDDIVTDPACNYVAAIGGDVHNYQRFPVRVGDRTIQYIVAGGSGAFMHATHTIPRVTVGGVHE